MKLPVLLLVLAFCSLFVGIGTLLAWKEFQKLRLALTAASWPVTDGTILDAKVDADNSGESTSYEAKVHYRYPVNDHVYTGSRLHHCYRGGGNQAAQSSLVARLAPGARVQVRYDPERPAESTLTAGYTRAALPGVVGGLLFAGFGLGFALIVLTTTGSKSEVENRLVILAQPAAR